MRNDKPPFLTTATDVDVDQFFVRWQEATQGEVKKAEEEYDQIKVIPSQAHSDDYDKIKQNPFVRNTIKNMLSRGLKTEDIIKNFTPQGDDPSPGTILENSVFNNAEALFTLEQATYLTQLKTLVDDDSGFAENYRDAVHWPAELWDEYAKQLTENHTSKPVTAENLSKFIEDQTEALIEQLSPQVRGNAQDKTATESSKLKDAINGTSHPSLKLLILDKLKRLKQNDDNAITTILTQQEELKTREDWTAAIFAYEQAQQQSLAKSGELSQTIPPPVKKTKLKRPAQTDESIIAIETAKPLQPLENETLAQYESGISFERKKEGDYHGAFRINGRQDFKILYHEDGPITTYATEAKSSPANPQTGQPHTPAKYPGKEEQYEILAKAMYFAKAARYGMAKDKLMLNGGYKKFPSINITLTCGAGIDSQQAANYYLEYFNQVTINNKVYKNPTPTSDNRDSVQAEENPTEELTVRIRARAQSFGEKIDEINANEKKPVERFEAYAKLLHKVQSEEISFSTDGYKDKNIALLQFYMMQARRKVMDTTKADQTKFLKNVTTLGKQGILKHPMAWLPGTDMDNYFEKHPSKLTLTELPLLAGAKTQLKKDDNQTINSAADIHEWVQQLPEHLKTEAFEIMYKEKVTKEDIGTILELAALDYPHYNEPLESRVKKDLWHTSFVGNKYNITANDLKKALGESTGQVPDHRVENLSHFLSKVDVEKNLDPLAQFDATQGSLPVVRLLKAKNHRFAKAYGATIVKAFKSSANINQSIIEALLPLHHQLSNLPDDQYRAEEDLIKTMTSKNITVGNTPIEAYLDDLVKFEPNSQATPQQRQLIEKYKAGTGHESDFIKNLKKSLLVQVNDFPLEVFTYGIGLLDERFDEEIIETVAGVATEDDDIKRTIVKYLNEQKNILKKTASDKKRNVFLTGQKDSLGTKPLAKGQLQEPKERLTGLLVNLKQKSVDSSSSGNEFQTKWLRSYYQGPTKTESHKKPKAFQKDPKIYKDKLTDEDEAALIETAKACTWYNNNGTAVDNFKDSQLRAANAWILSEASESYIDSDTKKENICYTNMVDSVLEKVENNEGKTEKERNKLLNENKNTLGRDGYMRNTELATFAHMLEISIKLITTHEHQATVIYDSENPHRHGDDVADITLHLTYIEDNEGNEKAHYYADPGKSEDIAADGLCGWTALHKAVMNSDNDIAKAELKKILTAGIKDYNEAVSEHKVHEASPSSPGLGN